MNFIILWFVIRGWTCYRQNMRFHFKFSSSDYVVKMDEKMLIVIVTLLVRNCIFAEGKKSKIMITTHLINISLTKSKIIWTTALSFRWAAHVSKVKYRQQIVCDHAIHAKMGAGEAHIIMSSRIYSLHFTSQRQRVIFGQCSGREGTVTNAEWQ